MEPIQKVFGLLILLVLVGYFGYSLLQSYNHSKRLYTQKIQSRISHIKYEVKGGYTVFYQDNNYFGAPTFMERAESETEENKFRVGDSLYKDENSLELKVYRMDSLSQYKLFKVLHGTPSFYRP